MYLKWNLLRVSRTPGQAAPPPLNPSLQQCATRRDRLGGLRRCGRADQSPTLLGSCPAPLKSLSTRSLLKVRTLRVRAPPRLSRAAALRVREGGSVRALQSRRSRGREQRPGTNGTGAPGGRGCAGRGKRREGSAPAFRQQLPLVGEPPGAGAAPRPLPRAPRPQRPAPRASRSRPRARPGVACRDSPGLPSWAPAHPRALPSAPPGWSRGAADPGTAASGGSEMGRGGRGADWGGARQARAAAGGAERGVRGGAVRGAAVCEARV